MIKGVGVGVEVGVEVGVGVGVGARELQDVSSRCSLTRLG